MDQISEYLSKIKSEDQISESTRKAYSGDLLKFLDFLQLNQKLNQPSQSLSVKSFFRFLENEKKKGLKASTLHRRRVSLKKFAEFLYERGEMEEGSVREIASWQENLWEEIANREAVSLSDEQVESIIKVIEAEEKPRNLRDRAIIDLILSTGISIGHLVNLNLNDLNLRNLSIRVDHQPGQWTRIDGTKKYLISYLTVSRPELTQNAGETALFVSQMGGRITRQGVWQVIKAWGKAAGLEISLSPRVLRHTAVRRMIQKNLPTKEIQKMLGHHNQHSTQALIRKISKTMDRGGSNGHERIYYD